jgi:hypothetical protein
MRTRTGTASPAASHVRCARVLSHCVHIMPWCRCAHRWHAHARAQTSFFKCSASAILRRSHIDMAILPVAADNDVAHLRMLREVMRRVDSADDALLRDPLVAAVHSICQALGLTSWLAQCFLSATSLRISLLSPATGSPLPDPSSGWPAGCAFVWGCASACCHHSLRSHLTVQAR